jgi:hypothetical protein
MARGPVSISRVTLISQRQALRATGTQVPSHRTEVPGQIMTEAPGKA